MKMREYLFIKKMTAAQMARELGVRPNYFRMINREDIKPGRQLALKIEMMTGGQVTFDELRGKNE